MEHNKVKTIIDFAIEREKEAVSFYNEILKASVFIGQQEFLQELVEMEQSHIQILQSLDSEKLDIATSEIQTPIITKSNYQIDSLYNNIKYQDILMSAINREEDSLSLYEDIALRSKGDAQLTFSRLALEEQKHREYFQNLLDDYWKDNY